MGIRRAAPLALFAFLASAVNIIYTGAHGFFAANFAKIPRRNLRNSAKFHRKVITLHCQ